MKHITDEMIKDVLLTVVHNSDIDEVWDDAKKVLREKGYTVDQPKSKVELAREYFNQSGLVSFHMPTLVNLYEQAISELQEEIKRLEKVDEWNKAIIQGLEAKEKELQEELKESNYRVAELVEGDDFEAIRLREQVKQKDEEIYSLKIEVNDYANEVVKAKQRYYESPKFKIDKACISYLKDLLITNSITPYTQNMTNEIFKALGIEN